MSGDTAIAAPQVTVIMNCYNGERYLREAIDSVYAQTMVDWEIVFWDNQSEDGSAGIAQAYDQRLRYCRAPERTPLSRARGLAMEQARGTYVAFLDVDDVWLPDTLATLLAGMQSGEQQYAACYGGYHTVNAAGDVTGAVRYRARAGILLGELLRQFEIMPCAVMVRRAALTETGLGFDPTLTASEEYCLFMQLAVTHPFQALDRPVARYRVHDGALTNQSIARWADEWQFTLDLIERKHPGIVDRYRTGFRHARARVDYYRARYLMHKCDSTGARKLLWRNITLDVRYLVLFIVAVLPGGMWKRIHAWYHGRNQLGDVK